MKAIILTAGEGTRLLPLTLNVPKALVPIFDTPLLEYTIRLLKKTGVKEIAINHPSNDETVINHLGSGEKYGVNIRYSPEEKLLGTSGSLIPLRDFFDDTFLVVYGDNLMSLDLQAIINAHKKSGALCTIALTKSLDPANSGIAAMDKKGRITRFKEKPGPNEIFSDNTNAGIYVIEPRIFKHLSSDTTSDFAKDLFPRLIDEGFEIHGIMIEGYLRDIGCPEQLLRAHADVLGNRADIPVPGTIQNDNNIWLDENCAIHPDARLVGPGYIGKHTIVRSGAIIGEGTAISENCLIGENAAIIGSIIRPAVRIAPDARITAAIIGNNAAIGKGVIVEQNVIIGEGVSIGNGTVCLAGSRIWPNKTIPANEIVRGDMTD